MTHDPKSFGKVAVLLGGSSAEREVSLMSGRGVLAALASRGVDAQAFDPAERELAELKHEGFARVFIALHGRHGEDGTVQGALELLGIPYTGSGVMASAIALDKVMTKRVWLAEGLSTPRWVVLPATGQRREDLREVPDRLGLPLIVKPPREGSSIGVTKVLGYSQMQDAVALAARYDPDVLCEEFIEGVELTCPVIGEGATARALPVVRIEAPEGNYDYEHKYFSNDTGYRCPSGLSPADETEVQEPTLEEEGQGDRRSRRHHHPASTSHHACLPQHHRRSPDPWHTARRPSPGLVARPLCPHHRRPFAAGRTLQRTAHPTRGPHR